MGFLESYLRLPRYQRVLLGLVGITVGWYGPSLMQYLFLDPGVLKGRSRAPAPTLTVTTNTDDHRSLPTVDTASRNN